MRQKQPVLSDFRVRSFPIRRGHRYSHGYEKRRRGYGTGYSGMMILLSFLPPLFFTWMKGWYGLNYRSWYLFSLQLSQNPIVGDEFEGGMIDACMYDTAQVGCRPYNVKGLETVITVL